jgi:hypothetical protein
MTRNGSIFRTSRRDCCTESNTRTSRSRISRLAACLLVGLFVGVAQTQAVLIHFKANLSNANECPACSVVSSGTGAYTLDTATGMVTMYLVHNVANQTAGHTHGPAGVCPASAGVLFGYPLGSPISLSYGPLTAAQMTDMQGSLHYANIHSTPCGSGACRDQIRPNTVNLQACCLQGGAVCMTTDPTTCAQLGGTPQGAGTNCTQANVCVCGPNPLAPDRCKPVSCPTPGQQCQPKCVRYNPAVGQTTVLQCVCMPPTQCHVLVPGANPTTGTGNPCEVPNAGGTVVLPPAGCAYLSPDQVHMIIDGLPAGTTIQFAPIHQQFICGKGSAQTPCSTPIPPGLCEDDGGGLGGKHDCFGSALNMTLNGTGTLSTWNRSVAMQLNCEVNTAPRTSGQSTQSFDTEMFRMQGQLPPGDPDFDLLRITAGSGFGLPSPGHTTLTQLPSGNWAVDSFFDITYRIDFIGHPGGHVGGMSGSTTGTIRMATGTAPTCTGTCPAGFVCEQSVTQNADGTFDICCNCVQPVCGPNPAQPDTCRQVTCPTPSDKCQPKCVKYNPLSGQSTVLDCVCMPPAECHVGVPGGLALLGGGNPCQVPNAGGTVDLPPAGCQYLNATEVHEIINGLPAGTTIQLAPIHKDFICHQQGNAVCSFPPGVTCDQPGGALGGEKECSESTLQLNMQGTGSLAAFNRTMNLPLSFETHVAPRSVGQPVQSFDTEMFRAFGQVTGDPDFDLLRIVAGNDFGLPSPGHTTLTQLPGGNWAVDSFFDITYRIDFVGHSPGPLGGMSGSTTGTIRMSTGNGPACTGGCPPGYNCVETRTVNPDGTIDICCNCVQQVCGPNPAQPDACLPVTCPISGQECQPRCVEYDPATGQTHVTDCVCRSPNECHVQVPSALTRGAGNPCEVPNNGGTVVLPPAGCDYLSPDDVHRILDGLPAGTTIEFAPIHQNFICNKQGVPPVPCSSFIPPGFCEAPGGGLGGQHDCFNSTISMALNGTGTLAGWNRTIDIPLACEVNTAPRTPGQPVQSFDTEMFRSQGQLPPGDPDFDLLRITAGSGNGLPSPGHTTLTQLPGGNWAVDSFFDITYRIDFVGHPGGHVGGMSGSTTATIRMATGNGPSCTGGCPPGYTCHRSTAVTPLGTIQICCDCVLDVTCQCPGDMNGDCKLNGLDINGFVKCLVAQPNPITAACICADINSDNVLNQVDLNLFVGLLLQVPKATCSPNCIPQP